VAVLNGQTNTVVATIPVGQLPQGVAVNPATNKVYVANSVVPGTVSVINGQRNTVTATIPVGAAPFGVAVNPKTGTVYVTNSGDGTVSVIAPCRK